MNKERQMLIPKIEEGTVIDKIPAGKSFQIIKILKVEIETAQPIAIGFKVISRQMKVKDIVKLTNRVLTEKELRSIWLISPDVKISVISNYEVTEQYLLSSKVFDNKFEGVLKCINPTCATNFREPVTPKFLVMDRNPLLVRCRYCDQVMLEDNVRAQF